MSATLSLKGRDIVVYESTTHSQLHTSFRGILGAKLTSSQVANVQITKDGDPTATTVEFLIYPNSSALLDRSANVDPISSGIAACCQLLYHANNLSDKRIFHFENHTNRFVKAFANMMRYSQDSMEEDIWHAFYNTISSQAQHYSSTAAINELAKYMTEDSKDLIYCKGKETITYGCNTCAGIQREEGAEHCLTYKGSANFGSGAEFSEAWRKDTITTTTEEWFTHWPTYLFVETSYNCDFVSLCAKYPFTLGASTKMEYKLAGAVLCDGITNTYITYVKRDNIWFAVGNEDPLEIGEWAPQSDGRPQLLLFEASSNTLPRSRLCDLVPQNTGLQSTIRPDLVTPGTHKSQRKHQHSNPTPCVQSQIPLKNEIGLSRVLSTCHLLSIVHEYCNKSLITFPLGAAPVLQALSTLLAKPDAAGSFDQFSVHVDTYTTDPVGFLVYAFAELAKFAPEENRKLFLFSKIHRTSIGCYNCTIDKKEEVPFQVLQYKGIENFTSSESFSAQWKRNFETEGRCKCGYNVSHTNYYENWPTVLFTATPTYSASIISRAAKYPFCLTLADKSTVTYHLLGALVKDVDDMHEALDLKKLSDINEDKESVLLVFRRDFGRPAPSMSNVYVYQALQVERDRFSQPAPHQEVASVLRLPNIGNSCWIAACCQLLYCAHLRSGRSLFAIDDSQKLPPYIKAFAQLMRGQMHVAWRDFFDTVFTIPQLVSKRFTQDDAGFFFESFIKEVLLYMSYDSKQQMTCSTIERTIQGCQKCNTQERDATKSCTFVKYAGSDDFHSHDEFSAQWIRTFEANDYCNCNIRKVVKKTNYFVHWPTFLFVRSTVDDDIIVNAMKHSFSLRNKTVSYKLVGAAIHTGENKRGHYTALVNSNCSPPSAYHSKYHISEIQILMIPGSAAVTNSMKRWGNTGAKTV